MITRILLAVDDSPDALAATRLAVGLVAGTGARLRAVHVSTDHRLGAAIGTVAGTTGAARREAAEVAVLARVAALAADAGVTAETMLLTGAVGSALLHAAHDWPADLVVIGRSSRGAVGDPYVGALTRHVLEFCEQPVLVVPAPLHRR